MSDALTASQRFFTNPTLEGFEELQRLAFQSAQYEPSAQRLLEIEAVITKANPISTLEALSELPSFYQVCPRYHYVVGRIQEVLGDVDAMRASIERLRTCLRCISQLGEGTKDEPYRVTFITDQEDIIRSFGEQKRYQQTATGNRRQLDVVTAHSGVEFWFDVTEIVMRHGELLSQELTSTSQI